MKASSDVTTSHGDVEWHDGRGTQRLETSFANVPIANNSGDVSVEASNGNVEAAGIGGALRVQNRFGGVNVARVGKGVSVMNSNGSVDVTDSGGAGEIKNSFGNVVVRGFKGDLTVNNTNGRVEATSVLGSTLRVRLRGEASYRVAARTSFGRIHTDFPLTVSGSLSDDNLNGAIGSGHCEMTLTDNNGAIEILKAGR